MTKEIQTSDRVLLEAEQVVKNLSSDENIDSVPVKQVTTLLDRLKARMSQTLLDIYSQGWEREGDASPGMQCLDKLRAYERTFSSLAPFIRVWHDATVSGGELLACAKAAEGEYFTPPKSLVMKAMSRDLDMALNSTTPEQVIPLLLDPKVPNEDITDEERKTFVERELTKAIVSLLRKEGMIEQVKGMVTAIAKHSDTPDDPASFKQFVPKDSAIFTEVQLLKALLWPAGAEVTQELVGTLHNNTAVTTIF